MKIEIMQPNPIMKTLWVKLLGASLGLMVFMKAGAATYYVDTANRHPVSPFTSWATAATNIQDAINAAGFTSNTIWVNDGVYKFGGIYSPAYARVATLGKPLTIQSVNGPEVTIIQGQSGWACARLTDGTVLSGFTLKNSTNYFVGFSGGVFCSSINCLVTNCFITGNFCGGGAGSSGGISGGTVIDCVVSNNQSFCGGAASNILINCTLVANYGGTCGGVYRSSLTNCLLLTNVSGSQNLISGGGAGLSFLENCTVSNNATANGFYNGDGGGLWYCTANDSLISSNRTGYSGSGGGAYNCSLSNCVVQNNYSPSSGGGVCAGALTNCVVASNVGGNGGGAANATLNNCLVTGNRAGYGGGVGNSFAINCTIVGNTNVGTGPAAGAYNSTLNNCIIYNNQAGTNADIYGCALTNCCTSSLAYPNIANSFTNDPALVDPSGDFHLQWNSPCINAGNSSLVTFTNDLDGNPRIVGSAVDVGAYEYQWPMSVIAYAWLEQYGLPVDGSADYTDDDGDGMDNWHEWQAGTDPTDPKSLLQLTSLGTTTNVPGVVVTWQSVANRNYYLQRSSDLTLQTPFISLQSNLVGQVGLTSYTDTTATNAGPYFYRVGVQ